MSNIAEGFNSRTMGQFVNLLGRARGSASEVQAQLYVALDREYISQDQFEEAYDLADKVSRQIYRFTRYLKSQSDGSRVKESTVSYDVSEEHLE